MSNLVRVLLPIDAIRLGPPLNLISYEGEYTWKGCSIDYTRWLSYFGSLLIAIPAASLNPKNKKKDSAEW